MLENLSFDVFIQRIRSGDADAARELVQRFEGLIRREVRLRIADRRLLRIFDSMDISQSVLNSFFARAGDGQYEIETPDQLASLLIGMARNKLAFAVRRQHARRRDSRLTTDQRIDELQVVSTTPGPSELATNHDLINTVRTRLGEEERTLADLRAEGYEWSEIASRMGGSPRARRMQLSRAVHKVAQTLRLEDEPR